MEDPPTRHQSGISSEGVPSRLDPGSSQAGSFARRGHPGLVGAILLLAVLATLGSAELARGDCIDYSDYLHWVGGVETPDRPIDVSVAGSYAYVADRESGLQIVDVSDPRVPEIVGSIAFISTVNRVFALGGYAFIGSSSDFLVIDVLDPTAPSEVGSVSFPQSMSDVVVVPPYAYSTNWAGGLNIIDISDPNHPEIVGTVDTPGLARGVAVVWPYAYVADASSGLQVIDVFDPETAAIVGTVDTPDYAVAVAVEGTYAYVADDAAGLQVIDVSIPGSPAIVGNADTPGAANGVAVAGDTVFLTAGTEGFFRIDVSDPSDPGIVWNAETAHLANGIALAGEYAYIINYTTAPECGLQIFDVSPAEAVELLGNYNIPGINPTGLTVVGTYAYVANGDQYGFTVIDVSDPAAPASEGFVDTPGYASNVVVDGAYAYVADSTPGLQVIDVSDLESPFIAATFPKNQVNDVAISGSYAFLAKGGYGETTQGLCIVDISNPLSPDSVGAVHTGRSLGIAVSGDYAYMTDTDNGLDVVDISDPALPLVVGDIDTPGYAIGVNVVGDYAYVADGDLGLQIIDISTPSAPQIVGAQDIPGIAYEVEVMGDYAYVAAGEIYVVDISDPTASEAIGYLHPPGGRDVWVTEDYLYAIGGSDGLGIGPVQCGMASPIIDGVPDIVYGAPAATDAAGDGNGIPVMDLSDSYHFDDADNWYFCFTIDGDIEATDWGKYVLYIDTTGDDQGATYDAWLRNVVVNDPHKPEYAIYTWVDGVDPYGPAKVEFYSWNGTSWDGPGTVEEAALGAGRGSGIEWRVSKASLAYPRTAWTEVWSTGGATTDNAQDTANDPAEDWNATDWTTTAVLDCSTLMEETIASPSGLAPGTPPSAQRLLLSSICPNPARVHSMISFNLPESGEVVVDLYDISGRLVRRLLEQPLDAGGHSLTWDGRDGAGVHVESGVYFLRVKANGQGRVTRVAVIR
ncbi:MAG: T9SS type A sorting domain-containing protein [Candidatus Eisenbacteria sp.]|nr:T9SS type A sorting domain-containing protein [Candidatus Eisenbacteria bacterium]